jgi:hypothetical protein
LLLLLDRIRALRDELEASLAALLHRRPSRAITTVPTTADEELDTDDEDAEDGDDCGGYNHNETSASSTTFPTPNTDC